MFVQSGHPACDELGIKRGTYVNIQNKEDCRKTEEAVFTSACCLLEEIYINATDSHTERIFIGIVDDN
jgi:hypothetical protein